MKLLAYSEDDTKVNYFGIKFSVPNFGYIAADRDGVVCWYVQEPEQSIINQGWTPADVSFIYLGKVDLEDLDWKESCCPVICLIRF